MFLLLSAFCEQPPYNRTMYNTTTRPKVIEKSLKGPFPFIVIFTNNSCEECKELIPKF